MSALEGPHLLLQSMVLKRKGHEFEMLERFLDERPDMPQHLNQDVITLLTSQLKQAVSKECLSTVDMEKANLLLSVIQHLGSQECHPDGLQIWISQGLHNLIKVFAAALQFALKSSTNVDRLYLDTLETITSLADYSPNGKAVMADEFSNRLLQVVTNDNFRFLPRIESLKTLNLLLQRCPASVRDNIKSASSHKENVRRLGKLVVNIGDYEFQISILEAWFRLTTTAGRLKDAKTWFSSEVYAAFRNVQESEFETDCRKFLNVLNTGGNVHSVPCQKVLLGKYELYKPDDTKYEHFWVDFNTGSKRISVFCGQNPTESQQDEFDEGMWETVSIWENNVQSYSLKGHGNTQTIEITLNSSGRDLIDYGPQFSDRKVLIDFNASCGIILPLLKTFGKDKYKEKPTKKCSAPEYPVHVESTSHELKVPVRENEQSYFRQPAAPVSTPKQQEQPRETPIRDKSATRRMMKVSVPCMPMNSPASLCTEQMSKSFQPLVMEPTRRQTPSGAKTGETKDGSTPKTPKGVVSRKRVKTPLQMVQTSTTPVRVPGNPCSIQNQKKGIQLPFEVDSGCGDVQLLHTFPAVCIDSDEIVPSSCPDEQMVIPESQEVTTVEAGREKEFAQLGKCDGKDEQDDFVKSNEKEQRIGQMAALKQRLTTTDPSYVTLPTNIHKVSNTPALSTVTEESNKSSPMSPHSKQTVKETKPMATIPELEDDFQHPAIGKRRKADGAKAKTIMSPDSTTVPHEMKPGRATKSKVINTKKSAGSNQNKKKLSSQQVQKTKGVNGQKRVTRSSGINTTHYLESPDENADEKRLQISKKNNESKKTTSTSLSKEVYPILNTSKSPENPTSQNGSMNKSDGLAGYRDITEESDSDKVESSQMSLTYQPKFFKSKYKLKTDHAQDRQQSDHIKGQSILKTPSATQVSKDKSGASEKRENVINRSGSKPKFFKSRDIETCEQPKTLKRISKELDSPLIISQDEENIYEFEPNLEILTQQTETSQKKTNKREVRCHEVEKVEEQEETVESRVMAPSQTNGGMDERKKKQKPPTANGQKGQKRRNRSKITEKSLSENFKEDLATPYTEGKEEKKIVESEAGNEPNSSVDAVADFARICQGLVERSGSEKPPRMRNRRNVNYKDLSDSEAENVPPTSRVGSVKKALIDPYVLDVELTKAEKHAQKAKRKHRGVFSETEDNSSVRSELSWLGSTARKKKKRSPVRAYKLKNRQLSKPKLINGVQGSQDEERSDDSDEESTQQPRLPPKLRKGGRKGKNESKSHRTHDGDEDSMNERYYDVGERKENIDKKNSRQILGPKLGEVRCPEKTLVGKNKTPKIKRQPLKTSMLSNISVGDDIEQMRFENSFETTPYLVVDSPYMPINVSLTELERRLPKYVLDDEDDEDQVTASEASCVTHISSLKTPKMLNVPADETDGSAGIKRNRWSFVDDMKSGPSKRRRRHQPFSVHQVDTDSEPGTSSESDQESDQSESDNSSDDKNPCVTGESFLKKFQPRRLFDNKGMQTAHLQVEEEFDEGENEEEEEAKDVESYAAITTMQLDVGIQGGIGSLVKSFGTEIQKNIQAKKQKLEQVSKGVLKSANKHVTGVWMQLQCDRQTYFDDFQEVLIGELLALEDDIKKAKDAEEKGLSLFQSQLSTIRQCNLSHTRRVQRLKKLEFEFVTGVQAMEQDQTSQQMSVRDGLRKDMQTLQKKMLQQVQKDEMMNMKRTLSAVFL